MKDILFIDSSFSLNNFIENSFKNSSYRIHSFHPEKLEIQILQKSYFQLFIANIQNLEDSILEYLTRALKEHSPQRPLLIICNQEQVEKIGLLFTGMEFDFLVPPLTNEELMARTQAMLRKAESQDETQALRSQELLIDLITREVYREQKFIPLQEYEFSLLVLLMKNAGQVLTKSQIIKHVWNYDFIPETNILDVLIWRLRAKLDRPFGRKLIQTVRGVGYRLAVLNNK